MPKSREVCFVKSITLCSFSHISLFGNIQECFFLFNYFHAFTWVSLSFISPHHHLNRVLHWSWYLSISSQACVSTIKALLFWKPRESLTNCGFRKSLWNPETNWQPLWAHHHTLLPSLHFPASSFPGGLLEGTGIGILATMRPSCIKPIYESFVSSHASTKGNALFMGNLSPSPFVLSQYRELSQFHRVTWGVHCCIGISWAQELTG